MRHPCPLSVMDVPRPDWLDIDSGLLIPIVMGTTIHTDNLMHRQIELPPTVTPFRTNLTGWFPTTNRPEVAFAKRLRRGNAPGRQLMQPPPYGYWVLSPSV